MTYGEQVLSRLNIPGVLLMVLGAVLVYASAPLTRRLFDATKQEKMNGKLIRKESAIFL